MASKNTHTPHRSRGRLGSYDLLYTLGIGGFGKVYLGEHIHLHSKAAVKVLHSAFVNDQAEKFKHEAQMVAQLAPHPHIVRVLDYNVQGGRPYIVMDYASHGNLRQRHTFGAKVPLPRVVSYVKQLASGLQHAHNSNVVHCDVKPENMFLGKQGKVLIGDFGIAVSLQEENAQSEDTFGTVSYMAPEQILGHPEPASDQYALAVVVYEWLTGELPFTGSDKPEIANKHLYEQPQSMRAINPAIPPAVEQVVMKALDKDPGRRYSSISIFAQAFEAASRARRTARAQQTPMTVKSRVRQPAHSPQRRTLRSLLLFHLSF
jgi:serine/threonine protein kinase